MARLLVAEDDDALRGMLETILEGEGYEVDAVPDGIRAMERLDGEPADLVMLDVMMPGADGFAVLRAIRSLTGWRDRPVIILSARSEDDDVWTGWQEGADHYMAKPFDVDELLEVVERLLKER